MFPKKYTLKGKIIIGIYLISLLTIVIISSSYILSYIYNSPNQSEPVANENSEVISTPISVPEENPSSTEVVPSQNVEGEPVEQEEDVATDLSENSKSDIENGIYSMEDLKILKEAHVVLYFNFQSFEITQEARAALESFADVIKAYPDEIYVIEGHADGYPNFSNTAMEVELVSNRIKAVYDVLIGHNLDLTKAEIINGGSSNPVSVQKEARQKNDYVEIYFRDYVIKNTNRK
ncbi:OmpA family protein [Fusibacter ferrireducens]|uniref:OmpA family protein n=1 Tax=Fusibacter ferrireducens TaxID=2785058 RepID=A0ABR9ZYJ7_9FIRM|nr:OmpA family protein [Fusibacter ferrireducens]MBF4695451.1 OmpA family protein [Fusibacter ferrireducens]